MVEARPREICSWLRLSLVMDPTSKNFSLSYYISIITPDQAEHPSITSSRNIIRTILEILTEVVNGRQKNNTTHFR